MSGKTFVLLLAVIAICVISTSNTHAVITGSKHDFSAAAWNPGAQICEPCHAPHTKAPLGQTPLWNHNTNTVANFYTVYASGTMNAAVGQPAGVSLLCLGCHDGSIALENFGGASGGTNYIPAVSQVGVLTGVPPAATNSNISGSHPISFTYNAALAVADPGLFNPTTKLSGITGAGTVATDMLFGVGNDQLECASCHDVHEPGAALIPANKFLVKTNAASALCLTCHNK